MADNTALPLSEKEQRFALWALRSLQFPLLKTADDCYVCEVPETERDRFDGVESFQFRLMCNGEGDSAFAPLTRESSFWRQLLARMTSHEGVWHAVPDDQPQHVHEISQRLFASYHVDGGNMHLGGCTLEDRPILRLSFGGRAADSSDTSQTDVSEYFVNLEGDVLEDDFIRALGVDQLHDHPSPPTLNKKQLREWRQQAEAKCRNEVGMSAPLMTVTVIWCKHAEGKVAIEIGEARGDVAFSHWAKPLADGQVAAPPFVCPISGLTSYHVTATSNGQMTVPEAVAVCRVTQQRVLLQELETCSETGQQVQRDLLATCPVTAARVLEEVLQECNVCKQRVQPKALRDSRCSACRSLRPVSKDDPRMALILGEHPKLDHWARWRMAETSNVFIASAAALFRALLIVVDKETLQLLRIAEGHRLSRRWVDAPPADQTELRE